MSKQVISIKGSMGFDEIIAFLEDLTDSFKKQTVVIQRGDEFVTLNPTQRINIQVEAAKKKGKQKLELELSWRDEVQADDEMPLKVSTEEPEIVIPTPEEIVENLLGESGEEKDDEKKEAEPAAEDKTEMKVGLEAEAPAAPVIEKKPAVKAKPKAAAKKAAKK